MTLLISPYSTYDSFYHPILNLCFVFFNLLVFQDYLLRIRGGHYETSRIVHYNVH
mgnify:CR=1 FL=1